MFPYIGGKKSHAKWISPYIPSDISTYVEVFGGAMWVYFMSDKTPVKRNVYNDFNPFLANIFKCATSNVQYYQGMCSTLIQHIGDEEKFKEYQHKIFNLEWERRAPLGNRPDYDLAAKYMFCQLQTFAGNTNFRADTKIYRSPDKKHKFVTYVEKLGQDKYLKKLRRLWVENLDCRELINRYDREGTFFYIDPPYYNMEKYYTADDFGHDDHTELLLRLRYTKARWALSYYYFDTLENILPKDQYHWHTEDTYSINARHSTATRQELLVMNYRQPSLEALF